MKRILATTILLTAVASTAFAQRGGRPAPPIGDGRHSGGHHGGGHGGYYPPGNGQSRYELETKVINKGAKVAQITRNKAAFLTASELRYVLDLEKQIIQLVRNAANNGGGGGYGPGPVSAKELILIAKRSAPAIAKKVEMIKIASRVTQKPVLNNISADCAYGSLQQENQCQNQRLSRVGRPLAVERPVAKKLIRRMCGSIVSIQAQNACIIDSANAVPMYGLQNKVNNCAYVHGPQRKNQCLQDALF